MYASLVIDLTIKYKSNHDFINLIKNLRNEWGLKYKQTASISEWIEMKNE